MEIDADDRIIRIKAVLAKTGLSRSALYRKINSGQFPRQIKISERSAGWRESAVLAWLRSPLFYDATDHPQG